jgi:hypothetical protein
MMARIGRLLLDVHASSDRSDRVAGRGKAIFQLEALFLELVINCLPKCVSSGKWQRDSRDIKEYLFKTWILNNGKWLL